MPTLFVLLSPISQLNLWLLFHLGFSVIKLVFWKPKCLNNLSTFQLILNLSKENGGYLLDPVYLFITVSCFLTLLSLFFLKIIPHNAYCYSPIPSQLTTWNYDLIAVHFMFFISVHIYFIILKVYITPFLWRFQNLLNLLLQNMRKIIKAAYSGYVCQFQSRRHLLTKYSLIVLILL